jgi:outer membrane scaffolding protein for murein synthesis (MipA/OmpV family)
MLGSSPLQLTTCNLLKEKTAYFARFWFYRLACRNLSGYVPFQNTDDVLTSLRFFMAALIVSFGAYTLPAQAADMRPVAPVIDDDDEDDKPAKAGSGLVAPSSSSDLTGTVFEPLAAKNWSAEVGLRQRLSSRQGKRRAVEGATGVTFDVVWKDTLFLSSDKGLGANLLQRRGIFSGNDRFVAGVAFNIDDQDGSDRSRSQSRSVDAKRGVSSFALGFAEYKIERWRLWTEIAHFLGNDRGNVVSLGAEYRLPLTTKWSTTFASGISFGDRAYMRDNYSVPAIYIPFQNPFYAQPKAGARDFTISADFEYRADDHWRWNTVIGFTNSLAVIQQGTFVKVRSEPFISTGVKYKF